jgi:hypothetical protein
MKLDHKFAIECLGKYPRQMALQESFQNQTASLLV